MRGFERQAVLQQSITEANQHWTLLVARHAQIVSVALRSLMMNSSLPANVLVQQLMLLTLEKNLLPYLLQEIFFFWNPRGRFELLRN